MKRSTPHPQIKCPHLFHPFVILILRVKKQSFFKRFCFVTSKRQALVNISGLTPGLKLNNFKLGVVHHSYDLNKVQFSGSVTNINVFRAKDKTLLKRQAEKPCSFSSKEAILSWPSMQWKITENVSQTTIHKHTLCSVTDYINLRLPLLWRKSSAKDFCSKLGDGKISEFSDPSNLSNLHMEEMYGNRFSECEFFWTPYSDENEEGVFINENSGEVVR